MKKLKIGIESISFKDLLLKIYSNYIENDLYEK
jgi:hypothetical protein